MCFLGLIYVFCDTPNRILSIHEPSSFCASEWDSPTSCGDNVLLFQSYLDDYCIIYFSQYSIKLNFPVLHIYNGIWCVCVHIARVWYLCLCEICVQLEITMLFSCTCISTTQNMSHFSFFHQAKPALALASSTTLYPLSAHRSPTTRPPVRAHCYLVLSTGPL